MDVVLVKYGTSKVRYECSTVVQVLLMYTQMYKQERGLRTVQYGKIPIP